MIELTQSFSMVYPVITVLSVCALLFMRLPKILKLLGVGTILYGSTAIFHQQYLVDLLGGAVKPIGILCLIFAGLIALWSLFSLLKAGIVLAFWSAIALVTFSIAFPDLSVANFAADASKHGKFLQQGVQSFIQAASSRISDLWLADSRETKK